MVIQPEVYVTPDRPTVRFREPRDQVDLDKELQKVLNAQGWGVGTYFHVQFLNHERTAVLASAEFMVSEVREGLHTRDVESYQPVTKMIFMRKLEQIGEWWPNLKSEVPDFVPGPGLPTVAGGAYEEPRKRGRPPKTATG